MDYYFHVLIDPVEIDSSLIIPENPPHPDEFRRYVFGLENFIISDNVSDMIEEINTARLDKINMGDILPCKKKYWTDQFDIGHKLFTMLMQYKSFNEHYLTNVLNGKNILDSQLKQYYEKIYDLADILSIRARKNRSILTKVLGKIMNECQKQNHIFYRLLLYLYVNLIHLSDYSSRSPGFPKLESILETKIKEFQKEEKIWKYFTKTELENYLALSIKMKQK